MDENQYAYLMQVLVEIKKSLKLIVIGATLAELAALAIWVWK